MANGDRLHSKLGEMRRMSGMLIGATFGMVFVLVNAHSPLQSVIGTTLRVLSVLTLAGLVVIAVRIGGRLGASTAVARAGWFGPRFWLVVAGELALFVLGNAVLQAWGAPRETTVAWIALVVGVHFIVLVTVWKQRGIAVPGVILSVLGTAGLVMAATPAVAWVPLVSGVLSGVTLLGGCVYGVIREYRAAA